MTHRIHAVALLAALATPALLPASARADEVAVGFVFRAGGETPGLADRVEAHLDAWLSAPASDVGAGDGWDERMCGPFDLVFGRVRAEVEDRGEGVFRVRVLLDDEGLRSGRASAVAVAGRIADHIRSGVENLAHGAQERLRSAADAELAHVTSRFVEVEQAILAIESEHGDPSARRDEAAARLRQVRAAWAEARIDTGVTRKQLERARAAAARAVEVAALEHRAEDLEREVAEQGSGASEQALRSLDELRALIDEARSKSPSLETARERVFDLEVDLVGHEDRAAQLAEEMRELRTEIRDLLGAARRYGDLVDERARLEGRRAGTEARRDALVARLSIPAFELLGPVASATPRTNPR